MASQPTKFLAVRLKRSRKIYKTMLFFVYIPICLKFTATLMCRSFAKIEEEAFLRNSLVNYLTHNVSFAEKSDHFATAAVKS